MEDSDIHIYCEDKPLFKHFINVPYCFPLQQVVHRSNIKRRHILDFVLADKLPVSVDDILCAAESRSSWFFIPNLLSSSMRQGT